MKFSAPSLLADAALRWFALRCRYVKCAGLWIAFGERSAWLELLVGGGKVCFDLLGDFDPCISVGRLGGGHGQFPGERQPISEELYGFGLGEMSASIAHEVNQPLAAIVTNGEAGLRWLTREVPDIAEALDAVRQMVSDADRASGVIRRIREVSRKGDPELSQLDINEVINAVVALVRREALSHRVTIRLQLASGLPPVRADRIQLQQVIINLAINGVQAMTTVTDRARVLTIQTEQHKSDQVLVAVQDVGVGVEPDELDRLFSAFYTTKPDGMGIGLSICRSIIDAHGGRVWASRNIGSGTTFQFTVPAYR